MEKQDAKRDAGFNPSVGMGWFQAPENIFQPVRRAWFQSLSRDGVVPGMEQRTCFSLFDSFNPSVGMGWFQASVKWRTHIVEISFNPSVGMGWFQAINPRLQRLQVYRFQSLSRDGVVPGVKLVGARRKVYQVSIPQSGWGGSRLRENSLARSYCLFQSLSRDGVVPGCPGR